MIWQGKYKRRQNLTKFDNFSDLFTSFKKFLNPKDVTELGQYRSKNWNVLQTDFESKTDQRNQIELKSLKTA